jgi:hypothetical protein
MRTELRKVEAALPGTGLKAAYELSRNGQQPPSEGDGVDVWGEIQLPVEGDGYLSKKLRFNNRVWMEGEPLGKTWGDRQLQGTCRKASKRFTAKTWKAAFTEAEAWAAGEIGKLVAALEKRQAALIAAEEE